MFGVIKKTTLLDSHKCWYIKVYWCFAFYCFLFLYGVIPFGCCCSPLYLPYFLFIWSAVAVPVSVVFYLSFMWFFSVGLYQIIFPVFSGFWSSKFPPSFCGLFTYLYYNSLPCPSVANLFYFRLILSTIWNFSFCLYKGSEKKFEKNIKKLLTRSPWFDILYLPARSPW